MKKVIQAIIIILLFVCIYIEIDYNRYLSNKNKEETPIIDVVNGLSVNYLNGKKVRIKNSKTISFSITNFEADSLSYIVKLIPDTIDADISYELINNDSIENHSKHKLESDTILDDISIKSQETQRYTLKITNNISKVVELELRVESKEYNQKFYETILSQNEIKESPETTFDTSATNAEGLIKDGTTNDSYYFRGNITNNYVSFANMSWRIIEINPDHSVKMVLDGVTESPVDMNQIPEQEESITYTNSFTELENWYNNTLKEYDNYISVSPDCFDNSIFKDENSYIEYLSDIRLFQDHLPTTNCKGTIISNKIALLTADEVNLAGGSTNPNNEYYLFIPNLPRSWWTMTPNKKENGITSYIVVQNNGAIAKDEPSTNQNYLRPVISLNYKTKVIGEGTKESPYVIID